MKHVFLFLLGLLVLSGMTVDEAVCEEGIVHSNGDYITDISVSGDTVWCATSGGVVAWNTGDGTSGKFTVADGLFDNLITSIACNDSVVWVGDYRNGICLRYNGEWITAGGFDFDLSDENMNFDRTYAVAAAPDGSVWYGVYGGAVHMSADGLSFRRYTADDGLPGSAVNAAAVAPDGTAWLGTGSGLARVADDAVTVFTASDGLADNSVIDIAVGGDGVVWVLAAEGVSRYDGSSWSTFDAPGEAPLSIGAGDDGDVYAGTDEGLFTLADYSWERLFPANGESGVAVTAVSCDAAGGIYAGTHGYGLRYYDGAVWHEYMTGDPLAHNTVLATAVDRNGSVWFGTHGGGVSRFDGTSWTTWTADDGLAGNDVRAAAVDRNGGIWFGTYQGDGVSYFDGENWTTYSTGDGLGSNNVFSIAVDYDDTVWFGTYGGGVTRYDGATWETFTADDGLAGNTVESITVDKNNVVWFGTYYGVSSFDGAEWTTYPKAYELASSTIRAAAVDHDNVKWFGTYHGVLRYDGDDWRLFTKTDGLIYNDVRAVAVDGNGVKWFGTLNGVSRFDGTSWKTFHDDIHLASRFVNAIAIDGDEVKWFGTEGGVTSFAGGVVVGVNEGDTAPEPFMLLPNIPNPFNPVTSIRFSLSRETRLSLKIYSVSGQLVTTLLSDTLAPGVHTAVWDGSDANGGAVSSGVYLAVLTGGGHTAHTKMLLLK